MGSIRITSGQYRGRKIQTPEGEQTRPLLTRLRKTLVDILRPRLQGAAVLDLFGGSGAIAIELISNGVASAEIVELHPPTAELVRRNAAALGLQEQIVVHQGDGIRMIAQLARPENRFDIIIVAPPYGQGLQQQALAALAPGTLLNESGIVIVQRDQHEPRPEPSGCLRFVRTRTYGRTVFDFFDRQTA